MTSIVTARDVSFALPDGRELWSGINLSLGREVTALVGANGVGKTTLARLLAGELQPARGTITRGAAMSLLRQRQAPPPVPVETFLGHAPWSLLREALLQGIDRGTPCSLLSGGQWMRVRLAQALDERFVILDEPTNDLDRQGREAVMRFLEGHGRGALLISHDRECLSVCHRVLELSHRGIASFGEGWTAYERKKERERHVALRALDAAKRARDDARAERIAQIARQEHRNRRGAADAARGGMPKILVGARKRRAQESTGKVDSGSLKRLDAAVRHAHEALQEVKVEPAMYADLLGEPLQPHRLVAEANQYNVWYGRWLYAEDLSFCWRGNAKVALKGPNGSGKSTLLKALLGEPLQSRGVFRPGGAAVLYLDQGCRTLDDAKSVLANVQHASGLNEGEARNGLARFLFSGAAAFHKAGQLSAGERLRATLACALLSEARPELLVLDEPTNNLDLVNVQFLESMVRSFPGAVVAVSHDEVFLGRCGITEDLVLPQGRPRGGTRVLAAERNANPTRHR